MRVWADTVAIIVAIPGGGVPHWRAIGSRHKDTRQDMDALRQEVRVEIAALNNRSDHLHQTLFSRQDLATWSHCLTGGGSGLATPAHTVR